MTLNIKEQTLVLQGNNYTLRDIKHIINSERKLEYTPSELDVLHFCHEWFSASPSIQLHTSGSTGLPKTIQASKLAMMESAKATVQFLNLEHGSSVLLCMGMSHIGAVMMVVRALIYGLNLVVVPPTANPLRHIKSRIDFAAMVPYQVQSTLNSNEEREQFIDIKDIIIGGAAINKELNSILQHFPNNIYSTYGMTETLSHIALRRISGKRASEFYTPLPNISIDISKDNTLIIYAPRICAQTIITNDIVEIASNGEFKILGRKDNIVNSGGIKLQIEALEAQLETYIESPFALSSTADKLLGEKLVLLIENPKRQTIEDIKTISNKILDKYSRPKHIILIDKIPCTPNNKIDRLHCKQIANKHTN